MTLRYHRLYQISSLEANLSLDDVKQLLGRSHLNSYTYPKTNKPDFNNDEKQTILNITSYCPGLKHLQGHSA